LQAEFAASLANPGLASQTMTARRNELTNSSMPSPRDSDTTSPGY
jgi:hypothetical protein